MGGEEERRKGRKYRGEERRLEKGEEEKRRRGEEEQRVDEEGWKERDGKGKEGGEESMSDHHYLS